MGRLLRSAGPVLLAAALSVAPYGDPSGLMPRLAQAQAPSAYVVELPAVANAYRPVLTPIASPDTVVVSGDLAGALVGYDAATGVLTFTQTLTASTPLAVGQVLASGPLPAAPVGLLRRVTAVEAQADSVIVQSTPATLSDALVQGDLRFSQTLTAADVVAAALPAGVSLQPMVGPLDDLAIPLVFSEVVLVDGDGNAATTHDQIRLTGEVVLRPNITLNARVEGSRLTEAEFGLGGVVTTRLTPNLQVTLGSLKAEKRVTTVPIAPFLVMVGLIPIPVTTQLTLLLGADGQMDASVQLAEIRTTTDLHAAARYLNGAVTSAGTATSHTDVQGFSAGVGASFELYAKARFEVSIAGLITAGPSAEIKLSVWSTVKTYEVPWWTLGWAVKAPIDLRLEVLGYSLAGIHLADVIDTRQTVAESTRNDLLFVTLSPPTPAHLALMAPVRVRFMYVTDEAVGARIWALPYSGGARCCAYSPSVVMPYGTGFTERSISLLAGSAHVDQIRLQLWSADQTRLLKEVPLAVDYTFGP